jgi:hypothetical protein
MLIVDYVEQCRYLRCDTARCFEDAVTQCTDCGDDVCDEHAAEMKTDPGWFSVYCPSCLAKSQGDCYEKNLVENISADSVRAVVGGRSATCG